LKSDSNILSKKIIALSQYRFVTISLYRNIARQNRSSDDGLIDVRDKKININKEKDIIKIKKMTN
jgi:hypothetical protein